MPSSLATAAHHDREAVIVGASVFAAHDRYPYTRAVDTFGRSSPASKSQMLTKV